MIISTFNVQNDFFKYRKNKSKIIYQYLKENNIDILGMQEVFYTLSKDLKKLMKHKYQMVGKYRFLLKLLHLTSNEKTSIVSPYKIIYNKTYNLPYKPSKLKRNMTHAIIDYNGVKISIYNTHLESDIDSVKSDELDKIYSIIKNDHNPKILMGDFNLKNSHDLFKKFVNKLKDINLNIIDVNEKTYKLSKDNKEIDHIFISNEFKLNKKEVPKNLDISDHFPILIDVDLKM